MADLYSAWVMTLLTLVDVDFDGGNDGGGGFCVVVGVELASEDVMTTSCGWSSFINQ
jgi:hypothetical protein